MSSHQKKILIENMLVELKADKTKLFAESELEALVPLEQRALSLSLLRHELQVKEQEVEYNFSGKRLKEFAPTVGRYQDAINSLRSDTRRDSRWLAEAERKLDSYAAAVNQYRSDLSGYREEAIKAWEALSDEDQTWFADGPMRQPIKSALDLPYQSDPMLGMYPGERRPRQARQIRDLEAALALLEEGFNES